MRDKPISIRPIIEAPPAASFLKGEPLVIDCDLCDYSGSVTCDDCLITYLCRPDRSSVVIELSDIRALRKLGQSGLVPELKLRKSVGSISDR